MTARKKHRNKFLGISFPLVALSAVLGLILVSSNLFKSQDKVLSSSTTFSISQVVDVANEVGTSFEQTGSLGNEVWIGTGGDNSTSYLGVRFQGDTIPQSSIIDSAKIEFTPSREQWISVGAVLSAEKSASAASFSSSSRPSQRTLTSASSSFSDDVKWLANSTYSYDVKAPVQEIVAAGATNTIAIIAKGTVGTWGRKFVPASSIRLTITYSQTGTVSPTPTLTPTPKPSTTLKPTPTTTPTSTETPVPTSTVMPTQSPVSGGAGIFGLVGADTLGTCSKEVHDKYVTTGPDGKLYRTWHPVKDPSGCTFAHEHGDDPAASRIFKGPVPFGYVASLIGMDEPHVGFKCFVHNAGTINDEGSSALHDTYYCFHMGTGGPARFNARFHSVDFHAKSAKGAVMNVSGMADIGNVGTICDNPRQQRTVQGFGCLIDSGYEIWENKLFIRNQGQTVATAITSTAVFDPITSMDPVDKTRLVYSWSDEAQQKIYKFVNDRTGNRGCQREAYSGPLAWYNQGGSQFYYTDVYGNTVDGGPLKQEISTVNNTFNTGYLDKFGALIMTYKSGNINDPQSQFKYHKSACEAGLGVKN